MWLYGCQRMFFQKTLFYEVTDQSNNTPLIKDYLCSVAPVPFAPFFQRTNELNKILKDVNLGNVQIYFNEESEPIYRPHREVFDVSGAGDTVISCLTSALLSGIDLIQAVTFANSAAGLVVGHVGTVPIRMDELKSIEF